jgi:hypothetical protein
MIVEVKFGKSYSMDLEDGKRLDYSIYPERYYSTLEMSVWEEDNPAALESYEGKHIHWERFIPSKRIAKWLIVRSVNKVSQRIAGVDLSE